MKQSFWLLCASLLFVLIGGSYASVSAQTPSATPDPFLVQITSNPNVAFTTALGDMSANGRFVVFVSNGDVSTERTTSRNNADGNREIFLFDYAQRRIFSDHKYPARSKSSAVTQPNADTKSNANAESDSNANSHSSGSLAGKDRDRQQISDDYSGAGTE